MMRNQRIIIQAAWLAITTAAALPGFVSADGPRGVSPGSPTQALLAASSCPSFSWSGDADAAGYELAVYNVHDDESLSPQLQIELAGDARGWTPPATDCPEAGGLYSWAVRALTADGPGPWSELLLFTTPGAPTEDEVRRALEVLQRYRSANVGEGFSPALDLDGNPSARRQAREDARSSPTPPHPGRAQDPPLLSSSIGADTPAPQAVTPPSTFSLNLSGDVDLGGFVFKNGNSFIHNSGDNTAVGTLALANVQPNFFTQKGLWNSAFGSRALVANTEGVSNTAVGRRALYSNVEGGDNTAIGDKALYKNLTNRNTALGSYALYENVSGFHNTAVGRLALHNTTGSVNTAIGSSAGINWTTGESNIAIGHGAYGLAGESGTIRIGGQGNQSRTFIGGIFGETPQYASVEMFIDGNGQLGAPVSSARFKQDIHSLEGVSDRLLDLRPVSFRYKDHDGQDGADAGERPLEYGLIAEEVAKVFPELVINDAEGRPFTVRYHLLTPLLVGQIQRLEDELGVLRREVADLRRPGPGNDCSEAATPVDRLICRNSELADLDRRMAATYEAALAAAGEVSDGSEVRDLQESQRNWAAELEVCLNTANPVECVSHRHEKRIARLQVEYGLISEDGRVSYACGDDPEDRLMTTYFATERRTVRLQRRDRSVLASLSGSPSEPEYLAEGGVTFRTVGDEAIVEWPHGNEFHCRVVERIERERPDSAGTPPPG